MMGTIGIILLFGGLMAVGVPLIELFILFGVTYTFRRLTWSERLEFIRSFLLRRAERKVFYAYLSVMSGIIGFPWGVGLVFQQVSPTSNFYLEIQFLNDNSIWASIIFGVAVSVCYLAYLYANTSKNQESYKKEIIKGLSVINREFEFEPNAEWFNTQATNGIKALGKRYDRKHNLVHPQLTLILAVLSRDISKTEGWMDDVESLIDKSYELLDKCDEKTKEKIASAIGDIINLVNTREWGEEEVKTFIEKIKTIDTSFTQWHDSLNHVDYDMVSYNWDQYHTEIQKFVDIIRSPWLECLYKQVMVVTGHGGMGKSHLIGNIVDERIQKGQPTILLLGEAFYDGPDPWNQIKEKLDVLCKKETFLTSLNTYAEGVGERVLVVIDAINEGRAGRAYWADQISNLVNEVSAYPHIGIVLSIRTSNNGSRLDDYINDHSHATYEAKGFADEQLAEACEYMFDSYGLATPSWAVVDGMFVNPLWLHIYCVSHEKLRKASERENRWQIVEQYIESFDVDLAKTFEYSKDRKLLEQVVFAMADKMIANKNAKNLKYSEAFEATDSCVGKDLNTKKYFDELLQIGILRQSVSNREASIQFEYEMFGRHIVAYRLASMYTKRQWDAMRPFMDEELAEVIPLVKGRELFTYYKKDEWESIYLEAFINTLQYRTSITKSGEQLLKKIWANKDYPLMFDVIQRCATNPQILYNATQLYKMLYGMPMMQRDALWTTEISWESKLRDRMNQIAQWTKNASTRTLSALDDEAVKLLAETLIWSLCSTQGKLRDTATKGLVNLLRYRQTILMYIIDKYHDVNDLYITERLWGVAFGCCTQNGDKQFAEDIAKLAQQYVFDKTPIVEHLLITDYARLILEYAISLGSKTFDGYEKHKAPYNKYKKLKKCSNAYIIRTYQKPYESHKDQNVSNSAMAILSSMAVEYSRRTNCHYGDFGRYTFQSALSRFPEDPEDLSNWAIDIIFKDFGYQPNDVKWFDSRLTNYGLSDWERIGKKYQWLALYKIAAILSDYHANAKPSERNEIPLIFSLRNIDPTVLKADAQKVSELQEMRHELPEYGYEKMDNLKWMQSPKHMPDVEQLVCQVNGNLAKNLVTMYARDEYTLRIDKLVLGEMNREFWCFIQSCFVDKSDASRIIKSIDKYGIAGKGFHENSDVNNIYAGEWYWSSNYKEYVVKQGYELKSLELSSHYFDDILIRPTMIEYMHESAYDHSSMHSDTIYYPNSNIVEVLNLKLYDGRSIWTNEAGEIVLFDNAVHGKENALMIRQDVLLEYLRKTNQVIIWPILIEKRIRSWHKQLHDKRFKYFQSGGYATMDETGKIISTIRQYDKEPTMVGRFMRKHIRPITNIISSELRDIGVKMHIVQLSEAEKMEYLIHQAWKKNKNKGL